MAEGSGPGSSGKKWILLTINQWVGLRENLNRKPWFLPSNKKGFPVNIPIIQFYELMMLVVAV
jgi:hypothetical protein